MHKLWNMNLHLCNCVEKVWCGTFSCLYFFACSLSASQTQNMSLLSVFLQTCCQHQTKKPLTSLQSSLVVLYAYLGMYICGCTCFLSAETILLVNLGFYYCLCCATLLCSAPCLLWSRCYFLCIIRLVIHTLERFCVSWQRIERIITRPQHVLISDWLIGAL